MGSAVSTYSWNVLQPYMNPEDANETDVALAPSQTLAAGTILGEVTASPGTYKAYSNTDLAAPATKPTMGSPAGSDGSIAAGDYLFGYTYENASGGETLMSPPSDPVTVGATNHVPTPNLGTLPTGVVAVNWFMSGGPGDDSMVFLVRKTSGASFNILTPPAGGSRRPPTTNTATAATDGSQNARVILKVGCTVDSSGNITGIGEWGIARKGVPVFIGGGAFFRTEDLVGLDDNAVAQMHAHLVEGTTSAGVLRF